jgi:hypothetical protein
MVICQHCSSDNIIYFAQINSNGAQVVAPRCGKCGQIPVKGQPFVSKKDYAWESLPLLQNLALSSEPCVVCGELGTEYHHFAPRFLFSDADSWPTAYLCARHHHEWHDKVTPDMAKKGKK